ncbi:MAG: hypothetical protein MUE65_05060, partial [Methanomassiliicoccales archaeon]|nr:hypothetical protein [Methanomassiliicoccales archaeon]
AAAAFLALTLATFLMQLAIICGAFGTIWFVGLLIRRLMPGVLKGVRLSTFGKGDDLTTRLMLWLMDIPNIVDASQLQVEVEPRRREFPWPRFSRLVMWELFLGTILAIYISLNPVLLESLELVQVFSVLGTFSVIIPLVIIPWFVLLAIQAGIPGVTRRFELFNGIRSRILQTFVALGTIVVFVRLALKDYDLGTILGSFLSYYVILGLISVYFAFVYLSFFETDLALEVEGRYRKLG